jgi:all-trans-retinol 13,14-reductase
MGCEKYDETTWPKFLLYMHFCHEKDPIYAKTGEIITYMNYDEVRQWEGTHTGHRGDEYNTFKTLKAEKIIDALEERVPGIRQSIECYYTSSPLTYHDYTNIPDGAMYGMAKNIHNYGSGNINCKTRIPNFYMTGQNITLHGMLGVLSGSFETCSEILSADEIFSQLEQYSGR